MFTPLRHRVGGPLRRQQTETSPEDLRVVPHAPWQVQRLNRGTRR